MWFYAMIVTLILLLMWFTRVRESFIDMPADVDLTTIPEPQELLKKVRELMNKYDKPEVWDHAAQVMDKDPGQLARMNLSIAN